MRITHSENKRKQMKLTEYLKAHKLIADGAFGTYYSIKYPETGDEIPELANTAHPESVLAVHRDYLNAGARLIRTNTFASNKAGLKTDIEHVCENIRAAVKTAGKAVKDYENVYIAGDIGPIAINERNGREAVQAEYIAIGHTFLDAGIKIILFETFSELDILVPVIKALKEYAECTIMVHFSVNQFGYSNMGLSARKLIREAADNPCIDIAGLNCGVGPGHMYKLLAGLNLESDILIAAMPNAGYPKYVQNRLTFTDNVDYFTDKISDIAALGVDILGGCCGTNPDYITAIAQRVSDATVPKHFISGDKKTEKVNPEDVGFAAGHKKNPDHKLIAVELAPPVNTNDEKLLEAAHMLARSNVDVVTFPDSPSGRTRADAILMAEKVRIETGLTVMPHICCRDRNAIALRSQIIGAKLNHIENFLVITGDPVPIMFRQETKSVFNFDSVGLMKILQEMNEDIFESAPVSYGGAINQNRPNTRVEISRIRKKMEAGACFFLSQPVFSDKELETLRQMKEETGATILVGIMPLVSRRNALFMKNEMTGINITDEIIARYDEKMTREEGEACGIAIANEIIAKSWDFADGYYFSFPFNRVHMLERMKLVNKNMSK